MARNRLSSVANAARAIKAFSSQHPTWGVGELADHLALSTSSTHRILATLTDEGVLEQEAATGRYRLGLSVFDLAAAEPTQRSLHEAALVSMYELRARTGETVQLGVLDGADVVYVERLDSPHTLHKFQEFGRRSHAHTSSIGKSLLAFQPSSQRDRLLADMALPRRTRHTITDMAEFRAELDTVRLQGYSENREEAEIGVVSVAAPIVDRIGTAMAALSLAGPIERLDPHRTSYVEIVKLLARAIATALR